MPLKDPPINIRFIEVRGAKYLRLEDIITFLTELGATEATDVRRRLDAAAKSLKNSPVAIDSIEHLTSTKP